MRSGIWIHCVFIRLHKCSTFNVHNELTLGSVHILHTPHCVANSKMLKMHYTYLRRSLQYRLWSLKSGDTKSERFLHNCSQMKLLNFETCSNGEASKSAKIWLSKSKIIRIFLIFFSLKNTNLGTYFLFLTPNFRQLATKLILKIWALFQEIKWLKNWCYQIMPITKSVLLNWYSLMKKKWERFGWFLT